mmetsp:Transcript_9124/g.32329  ORF Transcript_9124/g.32329 Transcript_9124/m.32329 type:complete len:102 (+) Transcript_9124:87-392(+)
MAARSALLSVVLAAVGALCALHAAASAFVGATGAKSALRGASSSLTRAALPGLVEGTSVALSLQVVTAAYWAVLILVTVPCGFLIILYLQSERTKAGMTPK